MCDKALVTGSTAGIGFSIASLMQPFGSPEEVAALIIDVCSLRASSTNRAALPVIGSAARSIV